MKQQIKQILKWSLLGVAGLIILLAIANGISESNRTAQQKSALPDLRTRYTDDVIDIRDVSFDEYATSDEFKYNYRTGYSGSYNYNYDVEGYGSDGYIYGNIDTSGKYGEGYIYDEYGNELWIETEWIDYGLMEAYDEYGNWYELEVY